MGGLPHIPSVFLHGVDLQDPLDKRQWGFHSWSLSGGSGMICAVPKISTLNNTLFFYETRSYELE
jgi:hypothetical protein